MVGKTGLKLGFAFAKRTDKWTIGRITKVKTFAYHMKGCVHFDMLALREQSKRWLKGYNRFHFLLLVSTKRAWLVPSAKLHGIQSVSDQTSSSLSGKNFFKCPLLPDYLRKTSLWPFHTSCDWSRREVFKLPRILHAFLGVFKKICLWFH